MVQLNGSEIIKSHSLQFFRFIIHENSFRKMSAIELEEFQESIFSAVQSNEMMVV